MIDLNNFYYLLAGLFVIILISTIGAIASRKLNFNYAYLGILSGILYFVLGFFVSQKAGLKAALVISGLVALFDSTLGFLLSIHFKANNKYSKVQSLEMIGVKTSIGVILFAGILTLVGYGLTCFS